MAASTRTSRTTGKTARPATTSKTAKTAAAAANADTGTRSRSGARPSAAKTAHAAGTSAGAPRNGPVPDDLRRNWIAEAAYYLAERRGFRGGSPEDDWSAAEAEIDRRLTGAQR